MAENWLVEEGIGEHRAMLLADDGILAARIEWPGTVAAGWVIDATLSSRSSGSPRGTAVTADGEEVLVTSLAKDAREGSPLRIEITRAALAGFGRFKRAQGRPTANALAQPNLAERLGAQVVRRAPGSGWDDLIDEALAAEVAFPGGKLLLAPTPAMTTVDIDGDLPPRALALAAATPLADAVRRFDLGGSIVVDFPTLVTKEDRRAVDGALGEALRGWPHERTAMNGFGLVQIVARLKRPSLLHLASAQRPRMVWNRLLRRAEALDGAGVIELTIHPSLEAVALAGDIAALERRAGKRVRLRKAASIALDAPHAQIIADA